MRTRTGDGQQQPIVQEDDGVLDELVLFDCDVHFEAMSDNTWWIGLSKAGHSWAINCGAKNANAGAFANVRDDGLYVPDPDYERPLPTKRGTMIGWSTWHDDNFYGGAVLDLDDDDSGNLVWWLLGMESKMTPEKLKSTVGNRWQMMGQIAPARDYSSKNALVLGKDSE
jgi:hypothetical protein